MPKLATKYKDLLLQGVIDDCVKIVYNDAEPADGSAADTPADQSGGTKLAERTGIGAGNWTGPQDNAEGDREIQIDKGGFIPVANGAASHVTFLDTDGDIITSIEASDGAGQALSLDTRFGYNNLKAPALTVKDLVTAS